MFKNILIATFALAFITACSASTQLTFNDPHEYENHINDLAVATNDPYEYELLN